jgi:deoxycytidylate deaminase
MPLVMGSNIELIIALVGPIGTDLEVVTTSLREFLDRANYQSRVIHLSRLFNLSKKDRHHPNLARRYSKLMDFGDNLREHFERKDAIAFLAVAKTSILRAKARKKSPPSEKMAVIIRQLKTPEEIASLRQIYGNRLVVVSCHAARSKRVDALAHRLADGSNEIQTAQFRAEAERLIQRDEQDHKSKWGQNVRKAFPMADLFLDVDNPEKLQNSAERLLEILFRHPHRTPTRDEYAMYLAEAAALRSAALGRQVGAVITTPGGDIIAVGCNEVPKAGGGLYWEGDTPDRRDHILGFDMNDRCKEKLIGEIIKRFVKASWIKGKHKKRGLNQLIRAAMYEKTNPILANTQVDSIIEFGRCVHAEMAAIVDAARRGASVDQGYLYTTTFPCHECARHIVAAGIRRVVYRHAYPKSLVRELYPDSIDIDGSSNHIERVVFEPFVGVAPRRYAQFFTMGDRKDEKGKVTKWKPGNANPNLGEYFPDQDLILRDERSFVDEFIGPVITE